MLFGKNINRYYGKYSLYFLMGIAALIAVDVYQLNIPNIIGLIIDGLRYETLTKVQLTGFMQELMIIVGVMFVGRFLWRICIFGNGIRIETDLRKRMFAHSLKLSQNYFQHNKTGALMALYTNDLQTVRASFGQGTVMLIDAIFLGFLAFTKMWKMDITLTLISSIPLLILALCGRIIGKYMSKKFAARQKAFANMSDFTQESFSGISVVKAFVKEGKELLAFGKINKDNYDRNLEFVKAGVLLQTLIGALIASIIVIIMGYGGYLVYQSQMNQTLAFTVGDLTKYISYFGTLTWPMMAIAQLINLRSQAQASLKRIDGLLNEQVDIKDENLVELDDIKGKITFNNLTFKYPQTEKNILENISFSINAGEKIGIIGRTGSGKTTLVDLLLRLYNLDPGQILIDDVDIMQLKIVKIRDAIAYVPQDNFLFSDTIENNINFAFATKNEEQVKNAAINADLDANVMEFKEGYQTILGERGVTISGGQKQRTSIARALMKDAPILILDDSVSAVDTKTEEIILKNIHNIRKGKTTILIAHRISTIKTMDKIALIDEGKLVGFGTHNQLLKTNTMYQQMVALQKLEDEVGGEIDG
ncbi:MAG: ABC transporter ATP-binding protein [Bacilli bacterium]